MTRSKKLPKVLREEEQERFLAEFNTRYPTPHRNLCLVRLMLEAGLRVGEAVALKPEHLDMRTCRLVIREGKGAEDRVLWIGDDLPDQIGEWLERRPESEWLFPTREGTQIQTRFVSLYIANFSGRWRIRTSDLCLVSYWQSSTYVCREPRHYGT